MSLVSQICLVCRLKAGIYAYREIYTYIIRFYIRQRKSVNSSLVFCFYRKIRWFYNLFKFYFIKWTVNNDNRLVIVSSRILCHFSRYLISVDTLSITRCCYDSSMIVQFIINPLSRILRNLTICTSCHIVIYHIRVRLRYALFLFTIVIIIIFDLLRTYKIFDDGRYRLINKTEVKF